MAKTKILKGSIPLPLFRENSVHKRDKIVRLVPPFPLCSIPSRPVESTEDFFFLFFCYQITFLTFTFFGAGGGGHFFFFLPYLFIYIFLTSGFFGAGGHFTSFFFFREKVQRTFLFYKIAI